MEAHAITEIKDSEGEIIGKWSEKSVQVTEPEVAQKITYMLQGAVEHGTAKGATNFWIGSGWKNGYNAASFLRCQMDQRITGLSDIHRYRWSDLVRV